MRFITTINNKKCLEWKITATQGALVSLIYEANSWAKEIVIEDKVYYYISRNLILQELPLFFEKSDTVYRNLKALNEKGIIEYVKQGKKDLIRLTEKGKTWNVIKSEKEELNSEINPSKIENSDSNPTKLGNKSEKNSDSNPTNKDNIYYKNTNNKDNNIYSAVINYLNEKTNRTGREKYNSNSKEIRKYIKARQSEGYTLEDFKQVIDNMTAAWIGTEWEQYLRPRTLFSNKFEDYLRWRKSSKNITKKSSSNNDFIVTEESLAETFGRYKQ